MSNWLIELKIGQLRYMFSDRRVFEVKELKVFSQSIILLCFTNWKHMQRKLLFAYFLSLQLRIWKASKLHNHVLSGVKKYFRPVELFAWHFDNVVVFIESIAHDSNLLLDCELIDEKIFCGHPHVESIYLKFNHIGCHFSQKVWME